jgi:radical SAM enzyme (TIGR01210 family)
VSEATTDARIRSLRPSKPYVDPFRAHGSLVEEERRPDAKSESALTVFLAGAECPFTCSFCDLWRFTIDGPAPPGALAAQLRAVLQDIDRPLPRRLKLYNASNFFDARSVPLDDMRAIADLARDFSAITVESHANTIGPRVLEFSRQISGRLEVAIGLETIHPGAIARLNKRLDLPRFDSAARFLSDNDIDLRVFVLLGAPHIPAADSIEWTVRSVEYAVGRGAAVVSIVPVRGGNGELERLQSLGDFTAPTLAELEQTLDRCSHVTAAVVTADLWDANRLAACEQCRQRRTERLAKMNVTARAEPLISCGHCSRP